MGMAASQARFLGLTARKTNVEYEGQQINQQRTTLANQSANYYNDLLGMSVPTPPSVDSFTKTVYTFNDGALTNTITALIAQGGSNYTLSYLQQYEDDFTPVSAATSIVTVSTDANNNTVYSIGADKLRKIGDFTGLKFDEYDANSNVTSHTGLTLGINNGEIVYMYNGVIYTPPDGSTIKLDTTNSTNSDEYLASLSGDQIINLFKEEQRYDALLDDKYGNGDWYVRYIQDTSTGISKPYFYKHSDLTGGTVTNGNIISNINCYTMGSATTTREIKAVENCQIEQDSTGRYISVTIPDANGGKPQTYSLTTNTVTDQDAYDDAMNQYEYDKQLYDQTINEINAKIEIIQAQDKNLELRLKQLDTEQDAISTEMDAVQKVIEKNTESTFKTFG